MMTGSVFVRSLRHTEGNTWVASFAPMRLLEQHTLPAGLFAFEMTRPNEELTRLMERSQRGLDLHLPVVNNRDHKLLLARQAFERIESRVDLGGHERISLGRRPC